MGDFDFTGQPDTSTRYGSHQANQGFQEPTDRSPFPVPKGWHGGQVDQTGGMIMVRRWYTHPGINRTHDSRPGRKHEYEVAYGSDPGVSIQKYTWNANAFRDGSGAYEFAGVVEQVPVQNNTDRAKAKEARRLLRKHQNKAQR